MVDYFKLQSNPRSCHNCGRYIYWNGFTLMALIEDQEFLGNNMLETIWNNPIFVIECCWCFNDMPVPEWAKV